MKIQTGGFTRSVQNDILKHLNDDNPDAQENLACLLKEGPTGQTLMNFIIDLFVRYCFKLKETFIDYYNLDENGNRQSVDDQKNLDDSEISYSYSKFNLRNYLISKLKQEVDPERKFQEVLQKEEETYINLSRKIPVYITYRTAFFDDFGQVHYRADVYGRDALVYMALVEAGVSLY